MKWTLLKGRSEFQKLEIQVSPVSGTCFDQSSSNNLNATRDDKGDATEIAHKQLLGQMVSMNVVDDEAPETAFHECSTGSSLTSSQYLTTATITTRASTGGS